MAVDMEWGGYDSVSKSENFQSSLVDHFDREGKNIEPEDIEDILLDVMNGEFSTLLEDGSEIEVAKSIWTLYHECIKGKTDLLQSLRLRAEKPISIQVTKQPGLEPSSSSESDSNNDDAMEEN